jgi:hypothetical protein
VQPQPTVADREIEAQHELRGQLNDVASQGELARSGGGEHSP